MVRGRVVERGGEGRKDRGRKRENGSTQDSDTPSVADAYLRAGLTDHRSGIQDRPLARENALGTTSFSATDSEGQYAMGEDEGGVRGEA